jgi:hypothetical protein
MTAPKMNGYDSEQMAHWLWLMPGYGGKALDAVPANEDPEPDALQGDHQMKAPGPVRLDDHPQRRDAG